jgi:hypothetical protein
MGSGGPGWKGWSKIMRKHRLLGLVFFAVFVFGVVLAASASAEVTLLAEWLVAGGPIMSNLASQTTGKMLFEDNKALGAKVDVLCSFILDGTIGPNGVDKIEKVLSLAGVEVSELAGAKPLSCESSLNCEAAGVLVPWFPRLLPWSTLLYLDQVTGRILDYIVGLHWEFTCTVLGVKVEDECTGASELASLEVSNTGEGGDAVMNGAAEPNGNCTTGGAGSGVNEAENDATTVESGLVTVSSEP